MTCASDHQPDGYIGVQFSELQTVMGDEMPMAPPMREYPKIDSVYVNSPASKAGARRGDVVLLIGGIDSRRPVQLDKLLKPGTKLTLRVQRDGSQKDLAITIEKRPTDFNSECANVDQFFAPEFDQPIYLRARACADGRAGHRSAAHARAGDRTRRADAADAAHVGLHVRILNDELRDRGSNAPGARR